MEFARERFAYHLDKTSDVSRQLSLAGIAVAAWVSTFLQSRKSYDSENFGQLNIAFAAFILALVLDFSRHFAGMCYYRLHRAGNETLRHTTNFGLTFVVVEAASAIVGYVFLLLSGI